MKRTALTSAFLSAAIILALSGCAQDINTAATTTSESATEAAEETEAVQTVTTTAAKITTTAGSLAESAAEAAETTTTAAGTTTEPADTTTTAAQTPAPTQPAVTVQTTVSQTTPVQTATTAQQTTTTSAQTTTAPQTTASAAQTTTTPAQTTTTTTPAQTTTTAPETTSAATEQVMRNRDGLGGNMNGFGSFDGTGNAGGFGGQSTSTAIISDTTVSVTLGSSAIDTSDLFSKRDLAQTADTSEAQTLTVADGGTITITEAGVYIIKGTAKNCTITVNADSSAKVQLVLDGVSITNDDFPAIYVISADKCFITTTDSTNTLAVTGQFRADGDTNTDAVIFSKDDLVLNGVGTLNITSSYANGISGKDDIKITGGTYNITTAKDSIEAHDSIRICGGTFTINSKKDGLHCENDEDGSVGWIYISDGTFRITASSDGIQATTILQIDGGTLDITASEGLEATYVQINGGKISISASDDGINASRKSTAISTPTIEFNGGETAIVMGQGDTDGVDANGNIYVNGGTVSVTGNSAFDYDGVGQINGGTVIVNGSQVTTLPNQMMGGGGFGGGFGGGGSFGGGFGGFGGRGMM